MYATQWISSLRSLLYQLVVVMCCIWFFDSILFWVFGLSCIQAPHLVISWIWFDKNIRIRLITSLKTVFLLKKIFFFIHLSKKDKMRCQGFRVRRIWTARLDLVPFKLGLLHASRPFYGESDSILWHSFKWIMWAWTNK